LIVSLVSDKIQKKDVFQSRKPAAGENTLPQKETVTRRVARLEEAMIRLTNAQAHLTEVQAASQTQMRKLDQKIAQMKAEALEREKRLDDRIEKLVSAIGELSRRNGKQS
jgi:predicted  nucleic acid-binding Zn-ribbon protein